MLRFMTGIPGSLEWRERENEKNNFTVIRGPMYVHVQCSPSHFKPTRSPEAITNGVTSPIEYDASSTPGVFRRRRTPLPGSTSRDELRTIPTLSKEGTQTGWEPNKCSMLITRIFTIGPSIPVSGCCYMWDLKRWAPNNEKKRL